MKSILPLRSNSIVKSFWNFAQSMAVILPCSVQNFSMIRELKFKLWINTLSHYFEFGMSFGRDPTLRQATVSAGKSMAPVARKGPFCVPSLIARLKILQDLILLSWMTLHNVLLTGISDNARWGGSLQENWFQQPNQTLQCLKILVTSIVSHDKLKLSKVN